MEIQEQKNKKLPIGCGIIELLIAICWMVWAFFHYCDGSFAVLWGGFIKNPVVYSLIIVIVIACWVLSFWYLAKNKESD